MKSAALFMAMSVLAGSVAAQQYATDATIEFENPYVRIVRVHYTPHEKTAIHDHPPFPTVYVYVTDGGRLRLSHEEEVVIRPPVKKDGIRFQKGVFERHSAEEIDGIESEYIRIELKTQPIDLPEVDVRRAPGDVTPYESRMLRILRVRCAAKSACPVSEHPEFPAVVIANGKYTWVPKGSAPIFNASDRPAEQVRVELKTAPKGDVK